MYQSRQMNHLREVFNELSYSHNSPIDIQDILEFIDQRCQNGHFDRDVFQQLVEQIKSASTGKITINDFIDVLLKAQGVLNDKIILCSQQVDLKLQLLKQYNDKMNQSKFTEIDSRSLTKINVEVLEGHLMYNSNGSLQISIQCGNSIQQTTFVLKQQLQWNQTFDFNVYSPQDFLEVILVDSELSSMRQIGGIVQLPISNYRDQLVHDIWVDLMDRQGTALRGRVHLRIQWIHSKSQYLNDMIRSEQQELDDLKQQIQDHKIDLDLIAQPFIAPPKKLEQLNQPSIPVIIKNYQEPITNEEIDTQIDHLVKLSMYLIIVYMILGLLVSSCRCIFLDFLVMFYSFIFYQKNHKLQSLLHIKIIIFILAVAILYDFAWLSIYSTPYFEEFNPKYDHLEYGIDKYEVVISWIMMIVKIIILAFYIHIYATYPDKSTQVYDQQWQTIFGKHTF